MAISKSRKKIVKKAKKPAKKARPKAPAKKAAKKSAKKTAKKIAKKSAAKKSPPKKIAKKKIMKKKAAGALKRAVRRTTTEIQPALPEAVLLHIDDLESMVAHASREASERVSAEAKKFEIGVPTNGLAAPQGELPWEYGKDRAVLLVVDPTFVFTYWEVTNDSIKRATESLGNDGKLTLRFYDVTRTHSIEGSNFWDVEVFDRLGNWYLRLLGPEQKICLEVGLKNSAGHFYALARSSVMRLPPQGLAKPGPIKWMVVTPAGDKLISDVEDYTDADLDLLKRILGPYFYDLLMRGKLATITGSSIEAIFYEVENFIGLQAGAGESPGSSPWSMA